MNQDFQDLLRELSETGANFLVVGAYALAAHGLPRATGDIDVWVEATEDNAALAISPPAGTFGASSAWALRCYLPRSNGSDYARVYSYNYAE